MCDLFDALGQPLRIPQVHWHKSPKANDRIAPPRGLPTLRSARDYPIRIGTDMAKLSIEQIYEQLTEALRDVFDDDDLAAHPELTAADVEGWDSMGNVRLFLAIEQALGVRFGAGEIGDIKNVGELAALVHRKL
jgi:acyl carrier protein